MQFLEPLSPPIDDAPEYIDGTLQRRHMSLFEVKLRSMRGVGWRQYALVDHTVEKPDVVMLSNDDMQCCIEGLHVGMESEHLFHIVFRNTPDGCEPFIMSAPSEGLFSEKQMKAIMVAATAAAQMGVILEFCDEVVARLPELHGIYEDCRHLGRVVAVPHYYVNDEGKRELHGVIVGLQSHPFPITANAWGRIFHYRIDDSMHALRVARRLGKLPHYDPQPLVARNDGVQRDEDWGKGWDQGVRVLRRERFVEYLEGLKDAGTETWGTFFKKALDQLGFADPYPFHPKRLYKKLKATHDRAAIALTEETLKTATELTTSAISQTWLDTLCNVLGGVTAVIPDAEKTFFVSFESGDKCKIAHNQPDELSNEEARALGLVALWAGFFGEATFDTAADNRMVFSHLRAMTQCDVSIVAIPVYSWEVDKNEAPTLHGVFVALRHPNASTPVYSTQLAWTLAAQYLLSPLAAKHDREAAPYKTNDIVSWYRWVYSQPFSPDSNTTPPIFFDY